MVEKRNSVAKRLMGVVRDYGIVLLICLVAILPFLLNDSLPQETDAELHIYRLLELSLLTRGGELYPRWAPHFYHGYGYPIFNYYAPLAYYVALPFELLPRVGPVGAVKATFVLSLLMAGAGAFALVRARWGRVGGWVAAALFVYSPYLQYIDPHARGVLAETLAFGLLPWALWGMTRLWGRGDRIGWFTAVFGVAAVILSHNLMGLLIFGLLVGWVIWNVVGILYSVFRHQEESNGLWVTAYRLQFARTIGALALAVGVSAFFWLVVALEQDAVNLNTLIGQGDNFDFRTHFLSLRELLAPTLRLDWGASEPAFRFNLGIAQWLFAAAGAVLMALGKVKERWQVGFFAFAAVFLIFLMLPASTFVWEAVPILPFFQFPWRLMGVAALMLAVVGGVGAGAFVEIFNAEVQRRKGQRVQRRLGAGLTAVFISIPILLGLPLAEVSPWPEFGEVSLLTLTEIELRGRWLGTTSTSDFLPSTVDIVPERKASLLKGFYENHPLDRINRAEGMIPDDVTIETEFVRPLLTHYHISSPNGYLMRLFLFDFPGWQVTIDGEPTETKLARPEGFINVRVPPGEQTVVVKFGQTPARWLGWGVTAVSLLLTMVVGIRYSGFNSQAVESQRQLFAINHLHLPNSGDGLIVIVLVCITAVYLLILHPLGWLHYDSAGLVAEPAQGQTLVDFGGQIALLGYDVPGQAAEDVRLRPGDELPLTLYWKAQQPLELNFQGFVHLRPADGIPVTQSDKLNPGEFPTRRWPLDSYVRDEHMLVLPEGMPTGEYVVSVGLWFQPEGWRLPILDAAGEQIGDNHFLFKVIVE